MPKPALVVCVLSGSVGPGWEALARAAGAQPGTALADETRDVARRAGQLTLVGEPASLAAAAEALVIAAAERDVALEELAFVTVGKDADGAAAATARQLAGAVTRGLGGRPVPPLRVEARGPRVRFLVELDRDDLPLADRLAHAVSDPVRGFPAVEARALPPVPGRYTEVEVTLCDPARTPLVPVFSALEILSREAGALCLATRLFGLAPRGVVTRSIAEEVYLADFAPRTHQLERVTRGTLQTC